MVAEFFDCGGVLLPLDRPHVVGILNLTPDSFFDGGRHTDPARAAERAWRMVEEGASLVELGGESTRPGAHPVPLDEERRRVLPVLERIRDLPVPLAVDTSDPALMREAAACGVRLVNDVRALSRPGALEAVRASGLAVCLMHMRGEPPTMQDDPRYADVVEDVHGFWPAGVTRLSPPASARGRSSSIPASVSARPSPTTVRFSAPSAVSAISAVRFSWVSRANPSSGLSREGRVP